MVKTKVLFRDVKNNSINNIQQGTDRKGQHQKQSCVAGVGILLLILFLKLLVLHLKTAILL